MNRFKGDPEKIIKTARAELGVVERPVNRTKYGEWFGWNGVAWCAIFCSWVFAMSGDKMPPISNKNGAAYVPTIVQHAQATGQWKPKSSGYVPKRGDLIVFWFTNRPDHVGIVQGVLPDGRIWTIEGNTNAAGSRTGGMVAELNRRSGIYGYVSIDAPSVDYTALRKWIAGGLFEKIQKLPTMWLNNYRSQNDVKVLQEILNFVGGEKLPLSGLYDAETDWAVQRFQKGVNRIEARSITENLGTFGPQTKMYLALALDNIRRGVG